MISERNTHGAQAPRVGACDRLDRPQLLLHAARSLDHTLHDVRWEPGAPRMVVVGETPRGGGRLHLLEIRDGAQLQTVFSTELPGGQLRCSSFGAAPAGAPVIATGGHDGSLALWDLRRPVSGGGISGTPVACVARAHTGIINCIDACGGGVWTGGYGPPEIATGGRDGHVCIWDTRNLSNEVPVARISPTSAKSDTDDRGPVPRDCWTVAFGHSYCDNERHVCAGYDSGDMKIYDLKDLSVHWQTNLKNGVCSLQYDRWNIKANKLVVGTLEANVYLFDMRTKHPKLGYTRLCKRAHEVPAAAAAAASAAAPVAPGPTTDPGQKSTSGSAAHTASGGCTVWSVRHLPQNRDVFMTSSGSGRLSVYTYHYPRQRSSVPKDTSDEADKKHPVGVVGTLELLNGATMADQAVPALDWSPDKQGLLAFISYDQNVRTAIVTRLNEI